MAKKVTKKTAEPIEEVKAIPEFDLPEVEETGATAEQKLNFILSFTHPNKRALIEDMLDGVDSDTLIEKYGRVRVLEFQKLLDQFNANPHKWNYVRNKHCVSCEG